MHRTIKYFSLLFLFILSMSCLCCNPSYLWNRELDITKFFSQDSGKLAKDFENITFRLAIFDDIYNNEKSLAFLGQFLLYPQKKKMIFVGLPLDAYYNINKKSTIIKKIPVQDADQIHKITGNRSHYYIHIQASNLIRFFNIIGGLQVFNKENILLKNSLYQHPHGRHYYSGEQILEYILLNKLNDSKPQALNFSLFFRQESVLFNLFWQYLFLDKSIDETLTPLIHSFFTTNLNFKDIRMIVKYIKTEKIQLSLQSLIFEESKLKNKKRIFIDWGKSKNFFQKAEKKLISSSSQKDKFALSILNGTNKARLAAKAKTILQKADINVVFVDNYKIKPIANSIFMEHSGDIDSAYMIQRIMGFSPDQIYFSSELSEVDGTLVLGDDTNLKRIRPSRGD